jgi:hypothetical protein
VANGGSKRRGKQQCETAEGRFPVQSLQHLVRRMFYLITVVLCPPISRLRLATSVQCPAARHQILSRTRRRGGPHAPQLGWTHVNQEDQLCSANTARVHIHGRVVSVCRTNSIQRRVDPVPSQIHMGSRGGGRVLVLGHSSCNAALSQQKPNVCLQPWTNSEPSAKGLVLALLPLEPPMSCMYVCVPVWRE